MDKVCDCVINVLNEMMVDGIKYEKIAGSYYDQMLFDNDELSDYLDDLFEVSKKDKTIYDYIKIDSNIEREFATACEQRDDIKFYFKLPFWFKIETPLGTYNPDWALVYENNKKIYFVVETKGTDDINDQCLSAGERNKIRCGIKHFANFPDVVFKAPVSKLNKVIV
jgi:type III restriction enzyme